MDAVMILLMLGAIAGLVRWLLINDKVAADKTRGLFAIRKTKIQENNAKTMLIRQQLRGK